MYVCVHAYACMMCACVCAVCVAGICMQCEYVRVHACVHGCACEHVCACVCACVFGSATSALSFCLISEAFYCYCVMLKLYLLNCR